jgi:hypothetical protein
MEHALGVEAAFGNVIAPSSAREHLDEYDALYVPQIDGASGPVDAPDCASSTRFLAWLDGGAPIAQRAWGKAVLLMADGVEGLSIGITERGDVFAGQDARARPALLELLEDREQRRRVDTLRTAQRLASATRGGPLERFTRGLALHFAAQGASSPFESAVQQIELDEHALEAWRDDALEREPDRCTREVWSGLARVLVLKRDIERIDRFVAPVAQVRPQLAGLELALACADMEMLEPARAAERLGAMIAAAPADIELRRLRARALLLAENALEAVRQLEAAAALDAARLDVRRELAIARVRAGDPRGTDEVRALQVALPDDKELALHAGPGPYPALAPRLPEPGGAERH